MYTLQQPNLLDLVVDGKTWLGYHQEWYEDEWQRLAGCGPTTATYLLAYHFLRDGRWDSIRDIAAARIHMNRVWQHVKPRRGGLFRTRWLAEGIEKFLQTEGIQEYCVRMLPISVLGRYRPKDTEVIEFIKAGFLADSPIAFLNRHRGNEKELETWHWVPVVSLNETTKGWLACAYDEGQERYFYPLNWLHATRLGGGLVYLEKREKS